MKMKDLPRKRPDLTEKMLAGTYKGINSATKSSFRCNSRNLPLTTYLPVRPSAHSPGGGGGVL